jgi:hypothetical protein
MTLDERIEFLVKSTESLHNSMHEMYERWDKEREAQQRALGELRAAELKHERAIMHAIVAYLDAKQGNGGTPQ